METACCGQAFAAIDIDLRLTLPKLWCSLAAASASPPWPLSVVVQTMRLEQLSTWLVGGARKFGGGVSGKPCSSLDGSVEVAGVRPPS